MGWGLEISGLQRRDKVFVRPLAFGVARKKFEILGFYYFWVCSLVQMLLVGLILF